MKLKLLCVVLFMPTLVSSFVPVSVVSEKSSQIVDVIKKYSIDTSWTTRISFSKDLVDRGNAQVGFSFLIPQCYVTLGPEAFKSEAVLASTLGHEVEVHCKQILKSFFRSVNQLEKEAYDYEVRNQQRFGTSDSFVSEIETTYNLYYGGNDEDNTGL
jgi:hypothetical protein